MKQFARPLGIAIGLLATALCIAYIAWSWRGQDLSVYATPRAVAGLAACVACCLAGVGISAAGWQRLLAGVGLDKPWGELAGIVSVTQIGKYLPGNVAQHIGRAGLALQRGLGPAPLAVTAVVEIVLLMLAGMAVGVVALLLSDQSLSAMPLANGEAAALIAGLVTAAICGLLALRAFGPTLLSRFAPRHAHLLGAAQLPSVSSIFVAFACYCAVYLAFGAGIVLMAQLLAPEVPQDRWLLVASFALAWIIGFVTPGAPAGLGVREGIMLLILGTAYPAATASVIVIALRLVTTLCDVLLLPLGWGLLRRHPAPATPSKEQS